jgi:hypothetical protein
MSPPLRARFVRTVGERDRVYVRRSDGSETSWVFPTYGDGLPHDLVHLVVERDFGVRDGFWGRVDRGVEPAKINELANRGGGAGKYAAFGEDLRELFVAEALANAAWSVTGEDLATRHAQLVNTCANLAWPAPARFSVEALGEAERRLRELQAKWRAAVPKGTLELEFSAT